MPYVTNLKRYYSPVDETLTFTFNVYLDRLVDDTAKEQIVKIMKDTVKNALSTDEEFRNKVKTAVDDAVKNLAFDVLTSTIRDAIKETLNENTNKSLDSVTVVGDAK